MRYRKVKASRIFDGERLHNDTILILDQENTVIDLVTAEETGNDVEKVEGIIMPGMINCHCHVELSHLKGTIPPKKGLIDFLIQVVQNRKAQHEDKEEAIEKAILEMKEKGIVGVADICNTTDAVQAKSKSPLYWHNLIEVLNFSDQTLEQRISDFGLVRQKHEDACLKAVLCGHAPYSLTESTFRAINAATTSAITSVHNQETAAENKLFLTGSGELDRFYLQFNNRLSPFPLIGKTSLQTWLPHFTNGQTIFLVHNIFITEADIEFAKDHALKYGLQLVYCLCPNANLYIEDRLPPVDLLMKHDCHIVLGTDSYSSNWELSIASEMKTLKQHFPHINIETLLQWATSNAAKALQWSSLGSFKKGAKPGVVLLKDDFTSKLLA
jgi:cytosine/adenosine deaminase-related metal-dependent hydrolase